VAVTADDRFVELVRRQAATDREGAARAARAFLATLAERIARDEARQLAARLPPEVGPRLFREAPAAEAFDIDEFLRRVAGREGVELETAERHSFAVISVLREVAERG
jgi:uncharacterized protein (DUF2267 family)